MVSPLKSQFSPEARNLFVRKVLFYNEKKMIKVPLESYITVISNNKYVFVTLETLLKKPWRADP